MPRPPLPEAVAALLVGKPNPAVVATLRRDGQPVSTATWYRWDEGRVVVNMDEGRKRLEHMRHDPRVALGVLMCLPGTRGMDALPGVPSVVESRRRREGCYCYECGDLV